MLTRDARRKAVAVEIDPFSDDFLADPLPGQEELRRAGPVVWLEQYNAYGMARFPEVSAALRNWETYCSGRGVGLADFAKETPWRVPSLLLETDPPVHDHMRAVLNPIVNVSVLNGFRASWKAIADELVGALVRKTNFDAVSELSEVFPLRVFPDAVGLAPGGRENLLPYAALAFNAFGPRNRLLEESLAQSAPLMEWVAASCKREALAVGSLGHRVFGAVDRGSITEEEAERLVRSFLTAGIDTTVNGIAGMIHAFAANPDQWRLVRSDRTLVRGAFEEVLRWCSPVQTFFRTTTRAVEVAGVDIPAGEKVLLFLGAANRDPERWPQPAEFDISRRAGGHVGFGLGVHSCLGQMIARIESETVLNALLDHFESVEMTSRPAYRLNNTLRSYASIPVKATADRVMHQLPSRQNGSEA